MRIGLMMALIAAVPQLATGHMSAHVYWIFRGKVQKDHLVS